jgi:hypothetical protein
MVLGISYLHTQVRENGSHYSSRFGAAGRGPPSVSA